MSIRAFLVQPQPLHSTSCVHLWPFLHTAMDYSDHQAITGKFCCLTRPLQCSFNPFSVSSSVSRLHSIGAVVAETCISSDVLSDSNSHPNTNYNEARCEVRGATCYDSVPAVTYSMSEKETQRRRRIGLANKGKIPWNKGRKHSPETCARIKEKTLEALSDPKVRKKMSESPRTHSEQSKKKIGSSLKRLWAERLKRKRSKEGFYSSWAESIAEAARRGGINEEQLDWGSYEKLKVEMAFQRQQLNEEKAKEKVMKRIQAEQKVQDRERNRNAELRSKKKEKKSCKAKNKEGGAASRELNITDKSTKVIGKVSIDGSPSAGVMIYLQSALEKFDIESIKAEQKRNTVSLADQIQAAKNRRRQGVSSGTTLATNSGALKQINT